MELTMIRDMWVGISLFLLLVVFLNKTAVFRNALSEPRPSWRLRLLFIAVFSAVGCFGAEWNIPTEGGLINFRAVGPITGGLLGGPLVGAVTGGLVGLYRVLCFTTTANAMHGCLTLLQGLAAGFLSFPVKAHRRMWLTGFLSAALLEAASAWLLLHGAGATPAEQEDIRRTLFPIIATNAVSVAFFIGILEDSVRLKERTSHATAQATFDAAEQMLETIRTGLTEDTMRRMETAIRRSLPQIGSLRIRRLSSDTDSEAESGARYTADIRDGRQTIARISAEKDGPLTSFERDFLDGIARLLSTAAEFDRLRREEELLAQSEIRRLQAQIHPHFLFNTLNTISYYCMSDPPAALDLIGYLSDYYRSSLKNPDALIPLSEEIRDIQNYLHLEKARFSDRLTVRFRLPDDLPLRLPPLLIQPLAENAVHHGILPAGRNGTVLIGVTVHRTFYKIYVADNGQGMDRDTVRSLLREAPGRQRIGLVNVNQRLTALYGPYNRLRITSRPGRGTIVSFRIRKEDAAS